MTRTPIERFYREAEQFVLVTDLPVADVLAMLEQSQVWITPDSGGGRREICASMKDGKLDPSGEETTIGWMEDIKPVDVDETYTVIQA